MSVELIDHFQVRELGCNMRGTGTESCNSGLVSGNASIALGWNKWGKQVRIGSHESWHRCCGSLIDGSIMAGVDGLVRL